VNRNPDRTAELISFFCLAIVLTGSAAWLIFCAVMATRGWCS
jgi:hypothetical protein